MTRPKTETTTPVAFLSDRLIEAMMVAAVSWLPEFEYDAETLTLWQSLRLANLNGLVRSSPALARRDIPLEGLRPLSANALAASLGDTASTTQARLKRLIERGWISKTRKGLIATAPEPRRATVDGLFDGVVAVFGRLIVQMATERRLGLPSACNYPVGALEMHAASLMGRQGVVLDYHYVSYTLRVMDAARATFECDALDPILFGTLAGLNPSAGIPATALLSVRALADLVEQPPETIRRRVRSLEDRGLVRDLRPGLSIPSETLTGERIITHARTVIQYFYQTQAAIARSLCRPA